MHITVKGRDYPVKVTESGCWEMYQGYWSGNDGYARLQIGNKKYTVTRLLMDCLPDKIVCHTCDNPSCVNPDHLYVGTHKDNNDDRWLRGPPARTGVQNVKKEALQVVLDNPDMHYAELADLAGVSIPTVYSWRKKYQQ